MLSGAAPLGKVPYVKIDGALHGDSQLIIELLTGGVDPLDAWLSPSARATAHNTRRMLEEGTYFLLAAARWVDDDGWAAYRPVFGRMLPAPLRPALLWWLLPSLGCAC